MGRFKREKKMRESLRDAMTIKRKYSVLEGSRTIEWKDVMNIMIGVVKGDKRAQEIAKELREKEYNINVGNRTITFNDFMHEVWELLIGLGMDRAYRRNNKYYIYDPTNTVYPITMKVCELTDLMVEKGIDPISGLIKIYEFFKGKRKKPFEIISKAGNALKKLLGKEKGFDEKFWRAVRYSDFESLGEIRKEKRIRLMEALKDGVRTIEEWETTEGYKVGENLQRLKELMLKGIALLGASLLREENRRKESVMEEHEIGYAVEERRGGKREVFHFTPGGDGKRVWWKKKADVRGQRATIGYAIDNLKDKFHGVDGAGVVVFGKGVAVFSFDGISGVTYREGKQQTIAMNNYMIERLKELCEQELSGKSDQEISSMLANILRNTYTVPVVALQFYDEKMGKWRLFVYWGTDGGFIVKGKNWSKELGGILEAKKGTPYPGYVNPQNTPQLINMDEFVGSSLMSAAINVYQPAVFCARSDGPFDVVVYSDGIGEDLKRIIKEKNEIKEVLKKRKTGDDASLAFAVFE